MRVRLQSLASAILSVRGWAESYAASDFVTQDDQRISTSVTETLLQCSTRLGAIFKNLHDVEAGSSGALARFWTGLRFAQDEKALHQSMNDLSTYTTSLQIAMQSRQGTDLTILRRQQTLHTKATAEYHTNTLSRIDEIQQHQVTTQSTMQAGFQDLMTTLQLTYLNEDQVHVEGDNLSTGVDALRYLNKHLSHSLASLSETDQGLTLPTDVAATLSGEIDKMIRYSQRCNQGVKQARFSGSDYAISQRIHTLPVRFRGQAIDDNGYIIIEATEGEDPLGRRTQHIRFTSFTVRPSGYGSAILGHVSRVNLGDGQQIQRHMRVLNILPYESRVFALAWDDDVEGMKRLLATGEASLLDYDEYGYGIFWYAATNLSWKTIHLLLDLGANASKCYIKGNNTMSDSIAWSIGLGVSDHIETSHDAGNIDLDPTESQLRMCRDLLHLSKTGFLETNTSGGLVRWTCNEPPKTPEAKILQERYFSILWDCGLGRRSIMGMAQDPHTLRSTFVAAMTAWARGRAVHHAPTISDKPSRTSLHILLLALVESWERYVDRLATLMETSTTDWERICRAVFYAETFRDNIQSRGTKLELEGRLSLLLLNQGVDPLQNDNEGVSAWDVVKESTDRVSFYRKILLPFITEERLRV